MVLQYCHSTKDCNFSTIGINGIKKAKKIFNLFLQNIAW